MPAYNFKRRFAEAVKEGSKTQTIRKKRKRPTVVGDKIFLYTGMRTKQSEKIGEGICISVIPIYIMEGSVIVGLPGDTIQLYAHSAGAEELATYDGFEDWDMFIIFFEDHYKFS